LVKKAKQASKAIHRRPADESPVVVTVAVAASKSALPNHAILVAP
jgi:hypothetical protein